MWFILGNQAYWITGINAYSTGKKRNETIREIQ